MPHMPKQLNSLGSLVRPELTSGVRAPQTKQIIPTRRPEKPAKRNHFMSQISPASYKGPETDPRNVFTTLFGEGYEENDHGVMVRKRKPRT